MLSSGGNLEQNEIRTAEDLNTHISKLESITIIQGLKRDFKKMN